MSRTTLIRCFGRIAGIALAFSAWSASPALAASSSEVICTGDGTRHALLIGNQAYAGSMQPLENPVRDTEAFGRLLCQHGFTVHRHGDLDLPAFETAIGRFAAAARGARTSLVYYSGHGFAAAGSNWLVPTDAKLACEDITAPDGSTYSPLRRRLVHLDEDLLARLNGTGDQIVILDACRTDPVKGCRGGAAPSLVRGFSRQQATTGRLKLFATQDGQVALDAVQGSNISPLMTAITKRLPLDPRQNWVASLSAVSTEVYELTGRRQLPNLDISLPPSGCLAPSCEAASQAAIVPPAPIAPAGPPPDEIAWTVLQTSNDGRAIENLIQRFPQGTWIPQARELLRDLKAWEAAERAGTRDAFEAYRQEFGDRGRFSGAAASRLAALPRPADPIAPPPPDKTPEAQPEPTLTPVVPKPRREVSRPPVETRPPPIRRPAPVARPAPAPRLQPSPRVAAKPRASKNCFVFNGERVCE